MNKKIVLSLLCLLVSPLFAPKRQARRVRVERAKRYFRPRFRIRCASCGITEKFAADSSFAKRFVCFSCKEKRRRIKRRVVK